MKKTLSMAITLIIVVQIIVIGIIPITVMSKDIGIASLNEYYDDVTENDKVEAALAYGYKASDDSNVLIDEVYKGEGYTAADLERFGWSALTGPGSVNPANGLLDLDNSRGIRMLKSGSSGTHTWFFGANKSLEVSQAGNDPYMTVRREHFKGKYQLDISIDHWRVYETQNRFRIQLNKIPSDSDSMDGFYYEYASRLIWTEINVANLGNPVGMDASSSHTIKVLIDSNEKKYQTFFNDNEEPASRNTDGATSLNMPLPYISGLQFFMSRNGTTDAYLNIQAIKLTELEKSADPTDTISAQLNTALLTNTPENITAPLNILPSAASLGVSGATISWSSNYPGIISNNGQVINTPISAMDVTLTAKITNNTDGYTQYADFKLTVPGMPSGIELINESYKGSGHTKAELGLLGWNAIDDGANAISSNGRLGLNNAEGVTMQRTITSALWGYMVNKRLSVLENGNDQYMIVRRENFKGKYNVELKLKHSRIDGTANNRFRIRYGPMGYEFVNGQIYHDSTSGGSYGANNPPELNTNTEHNPKLEAIIDTSSNTFQTFSNDNLLIKSDGVSEIPINTAFPNHENYIMGTQFWFYGTSAANPYVNVESLKLTEYRRDSDPTDAVVAQLNTAMLTNTPENVTTPLNALPAAFSDVTVTWSSNSPGIISNDGQTINKSTATLCVIMTAKITNNVDGFTQYADFTLTVPGMTLGAEFINESYIGSNYTDTELAELGFSVLEGTEYDSSNGNLGSNSINGITMSRVGASTSATSSFYYIIDKRLSAIENGSDQYMTVRRDGFKGRYKIDLNLTYSRINNANNRFNIHFGSMEHGFGSGAILTPAMNGSPLLGYGLNNPIGLNGGDEQTIHKSQLETIIDTGNKTYQTFYNQDLLLRQEDGISTIDISNANGIYAGYITGLQFKLDRMSEANAYVNIEALKMTEIRRDLDPTDAVIAQLSTSVLTNTPTYITAALNPLPSEFADVTVTWRSSNSDVISNDGQIINRAPFSKDVTMTATITNNADGFTQYVDFILTVGGLAITGDMPSVSNVRTTGGTTVGSILSVSYMFNDIYGYNDNSEFMWYYVQGGSFINIPGATGRTYTVQSSDAGRAICASVIPRNSINVIGQAVYSNSIFIQGPSGNNGGGNSSGGNSGGLVMANFTADISTVNNNSQDEKLPIEGYNVFNDIPVGHWASKAIDTLSNLGILSGDGSGSFNPNKQVTREQFAKIIALIFDASDENATEMFVDVSESDWSYPYIASLSNYSIILGDSNGFFNKEDNITREDMAVIIWRAANKFGITLQTIRNFEFEDAEDISDYAREAVEMLANSGIVNGSDGTFKPKDFCTRAEAAKIAYEIYRLIGVQ